MHALGWRWVALLLWAVQPAVPAAAEPPALSILLAEPDIESVEISPDGRYLALLGTTAAGGRELLTLSHPQHQLAGRFGFRGSAEEIARYWWVKDHHLVLKPQRRSGWAEFDVQLIDLYAASADGSDFVAIYGKNINNHDRMTRIQVAPAVSGWATLLSDLPASPNEVLLAINPYQASATAVPFVVRARIDRGRHRRLMTAPAYNAEFLASPLGEVRFALAVDRNNQLGVYRYAEDRTRWQLVTRFGVGQGQGFDPVSVAADGKRAWFLSQPPGGRIALQQIDLPDGQVRQVYADAERDVSGVLSDRFSGTPYALTVGPEQRLVELDPEHPLTRMQRALSNTFPRHSAGITSASRDLSTAIAYVASDRDPGGWYAIDAASRRVDPLFSRYPGIDPQQMAPMRAVRLRARDGLELAGWYTRMPAAADAPPPPMVVLVHGGPYGIEDRWLFNPQVQALATRGYAVLQINFRGSGGRGRAFEEAGFGEWGLRMQDDLTDATRWAIEQRLADSQRICIMGASYGGYASLMAVTRDPGLFRCAIDIAGVSDLQAFMNSGDIPEQLFGRAYLQQAIGTDPAQWALRSPLRLADRIRVPVLIVAGGQDERVPVAHSQNMEAALRSAGGQVEALYFPFEGHHFEKLENRVTMMQRVLDFLQRSLQTA